MKIQIFIHSCFLVAAICVAEEAKQATAIVDLESLKKLEIENKKFKEESLGLSFNYHVLLLEKLDPNTDKGLKLMLSKSLLDRFFRYYILVDEGLLQADKSVDYALEIAVKKRLIDLELIAQDKLNFTSQVELIDPKVKTPYGLFLSDEQNIILSKRFRAHVLSIYNKSSPK